MLVLHVFTSSPVPVIKLPLLHQLKYIQCASMSRSTGEGCLGHIWLHADPFCITCFKHDAQASAVFHLPLYSIQHVSTFACGCRMPRSPSLLRQHALTLMPEQEQRLTHVVQVSLAQSQGILVTPARPRPLLPAACLRRNQTGMPCSAGVMAENRGSTTFSLHRPYGLHGYANHTAHHECIVSELGTPS
jgi:hypothetical protein